MESWCRKRLLCSITVPVVCRQHLCESSADYIRSSKRGNRIIRNPSPVRGPWPQCEEWVPMHRGKHFSSARDTWIVFVWVLPVLTEEIAWPACDGACCTSEATRTERTDCFTQDPRVCQWQNVLYLTLVSFYPSLLSVNINFWYTLSLC